MLQNELAFVNRQLAEASRTTEQAAQIQTEIDRVYGRLEAAQTAQQTLLGNQGNARDGLVKVISALPPGSHVTTLNVVPEQTLIQGYASDSFQVLEYVANLGQSGLSGDIRTSFIEEVPTEPQVTFEVTITR